VESWISLASNTDLIAVSNPACVVPLFLPVEIGLLAARVRADGEWSTGLLPKAKMTLVKPETGKFGLAIAGGASFNALTGENTGAFFNIPVTYTVSETFKLNVNAGWLYDRPNALHYATYGAGFEWHPTSRSSVVASWEHRFFGAAYLFTFDHRTPLSVWGARVSRNITSFPQQLASLPAGGDVATLLNGLFLATIPDPVQRQLAIDQFIRDRGLPSVLPGALSLYSQQILLQESQSASVGLLGARNTVVLAIFNVRSQPVSASGDALTPLSLGNDNNRQTGVSLLWSHKLTPSLATDATIERFRTVANPPFEARSNQTAVRFVFTATLSAKTTMFAGARYQIVSSDAVGTAYNEAAAFVGVNHNFR
jgi:uncharacterized protein (PEP-CTERM system associated)